MANTALAVQTEVVSPAEFLDDLAARLERRIAAIGRRLLADGLDLAARAELRRERTVLDDVRLAIARRDTALIPDDGEPASPPEAEEPPILLAQLPDGQIDREQLAKLRALIVSRRDGRVADRGTAAARAGIARSIGDDQRRLIGAWLRAYDAERARIDRLAAAALPITGLARPAGLPVLLLEAADDHALFAALAAHPDADSRWMAASDRALLLELELGPEPQAIVAQVADLGILAVVRALGDQVYLAPAGCAAPVGPVRLDVDGLERLLRRIGRSSYEGVL